MDKPTTEKPVCQEVFSPHHTIKRYLESLLEIPPPGGGGCHAALLGVANRGVHAGLSEQQLFKDIRGAIPRGKRRVPDGEILAAIRRAIVDAGAQEDPKPYVQKPQIDGKAALQRILADGKAEDEADLWELSPVRLDWEPQEDTQRFLAAMYEPDELVFIGDRCEAGILGKNIRTVRKWIDFFKSGGKAGPFIVINPLTGKRSKTKNGDRETYRGDGCIASYRYALAEFDDLPKEQQIRFWTGARLDIKAMVDSGGKSVHAWLLVEVSGGDEWDTEIRGKLYDCALTPIGIDSTCRNPARLARLPGCVRGENIQKILYLRG